MRPARGSLDERLRELFARESVSLRITRLRLIRVTTPRAALVPRVAAGVLLILLAVAAGGAISRLRTPPSVSAPTDAVGGPVSAAPAVLESPLPEATASPDLAASPPPTPVPSQVCAEYRSAGYLSVCPSAGPIGSTVVVEGTGCNNPGQPVYLVFLGDRPMTTGTVGAQDLGRVLTDQRGYFRVTYRIPAEFGAIQGRGGGVITPGTYLFESRPPYCGVTFTVVP